MKLTPDYIASAIDFDGTITASLVVEPNHKSPTLLTNVQITCQSLSVLVKIMNTLECGDIRAYRGGYKRTSGAYRYSVPRTHQVRVLNLLLPYFEVKQEQAELVLQLHAYKGRGSRRLPESIQELRRLLVEKIQELNQSVGKVYRSKWVNSVNTSSLVAKYEAIPSQAVEGEGSTEGVTTSPVSPNNNLDHERPPRKGRDSLSTTVM
jgi:hypothetical protein